MGTEVLRPHDVLNSGIGGLSASIQRRGCGIAVIGRKRIPNVGNKKPSKKKTGVPPEKSAAKRAKIRSPLDSRKKGEPAAAGLLIGKVTLLRRGESLDSLTQKFNGGAADLAILGPAIIRPKTPEITPIRPFSPQPPRVYAGSAFYSSPCPPSLPLPNKTQDASTYAESATEDLRRLLRLG